MKVGVDIRRQSAALLWFRYFKEFTYVLSSSVTVGQLNEDTAKQKA